MLHVLATTPPRGVIDCFLKQSYPDCRMMILDDAGQYEPQSGDKWELHVAPCRYPALGAKRNSLARMAFADPIVDAIAVCDDDDYYFPHWMDCLAAALEKGPWCVATQVYSQVKPG